MTGDKRTLADHWTIVDDLPVFYRSAESVAPPGTLPVVLVHGFAISGRYWMPTAELLARSHPVYIPDLPGHGRSPAPGRVLTIRELAIALARFMDAVGIERAILLGSSMGCFTIVELASLYPERVDRAVLVSPAGGRHNQPLLRGMAQLARAALHEPPRLLPIALSDYVRFGVFDSLRAFRVMTSYPMAKRAGDLDQPIVVVAGARDPMVSLAQLRDLCDVNPNMTMVVHRQAAHAINFSHPQFLADLVRTWPCQPHVD